MKIKRKFMPYYFSRALIAALLGWIVAASSGSLVMGIAIGLLVFAGFIYYLHSGRFIVDESHPFFPLRRDERAESIRNKALVVAVTAGGLVYFLIYLINRFAMLPNFSTSLALPAAVAVYFIASFMMDIKV